MAHLTEAEIDEKFRELVTLIKAQAPDRIGALQDMLEKEAQHETTETMPQITEDQKPKDKNGFDNR